MLHVIAELDFSGTVNFDTDYSTPPLVTVTSSADNGSHATIQAVFAGGDVIDIPVTLKYEVDDNVFLVNFNVEATGTLVLNDLILSNLTLGMRYYPELPRWVFSNGWHNSVKMAYADKYRPDELAALPVEDCGEGVDCLEFIGFTDNTDNKKSLLVIAGEHDWVDGDASPQPVDAPDLSLFDEVDDLFNPENSDIDRIYDGRTVEDPLALGDTEQDKILVIDEL